MVKFRTYVSTALSTLPLCEGLNPNEIKKKWRGCVRIIATGVFNIDGRCNTSLYDDKRDRYFMRRLTQNQLTKLHKNNGIDIVWVPNDFKFGQLCDITEKAYAEKT